MQNFWFETELISSKSRKRIIDISLKNIFLSLTEDNLRHGHSGWISPEPENNTFCPDVTYNNVEYINTLYFFARNKLIPVALGDFPKPIYGYGHFDFRHPFGILF